MNNIKADFRRLQRCYLNLYSIRMIKKFKIRSIGYFDMFDPRVASLKQLPCDVSYKKRRNRIKIPRYLEEQIEIFEQFILYCHNQVK